ncbi:MAG: hypothetical protein F6J94_20050 [Moorea sp. SIO1F2]|uniref:hypothetical protein n=1 Tax=Moorena sp. SIO1F2 TaxID=2607819 RepID=UPI0013B7915D|nr:hypothetical protein [Moorena sp. SIO1F2]NET84124.1 hypothetical protein [Moorena sp. SIO1F2]
MLNHSIIQQHLAFYHRRCTSQTQTPKPLFLKLLMKTPLSNALFKSGHSTTPLPIPYSLLPVPFAK